MNILTKLLDNLQRLFKKQTTTTNGETKISWLDYCKPPY